MRTVSRPFVLSMYEALGFDTGKRESFAMSGGAPVFIFVVAMALLLVKGIIIVVENRTLR